MTRNEILLAMAAGQPLIPLAAQKYKIVSHGTVSQRTFSALNSDGYIYRGDNGLYWLTKTGKAVANGLVEQNTAAEELLTSAKAVLQSLSDLPDVEATSRVTIINQLRHAIRNFERHLSKGGI